MKTLKLLGAGLLALATVASASASTLYVTGSTAFRKGLYAAIVNHLGSGCKAAFVGSALNGANQATFTNGTDTVYCCMAGSVGGINWVVNTVNVATAPGGNTAKAWIKATNATVGASVVSGQATGGVAVTDVPATWDPAHVADATMSDSYQDSTAFNSGVSPFVALAEAGGGSNGIVLFVFAKGTRNTTIPQASYDRFTNVTPLAFRDLAANGIAPLSLFTGNSADANIDVVLVGRDNDSGTRLAVMFETGTGNVNFPAKQYFAQDAGGVDVGTNTGAGVIKQLANAFGLVGYASGGSVKNVLNKGIDSTAVDSHGKPFIILGYVGTGDAPTAIQIAPTGQILTYSGIGLYDSAGNQLPDLARYGQYSFWTNEHMYYNGDTIDAGSQAIADAVNTLVGSTFATSAGGLLTGSMHVTRGGEGAVIVP